MKKKLSLKKAFIAFSVVLFTFLACDKDYATLGTDIIGNSNFATDKVSYQAITYNQKLNPVQTNALSSYLLGVYNDPIYGTSSASFVSQLDITERALGENIELDSVVLTIPYFSHVNTDDPTDDDGNTNYILDSVYGNLDAPMRLSIYRNNYFLRDYDPETDFEDSQKYYSDGSTSEGNAIPQSDLESELIFEDDQFFIKSDEVRLTALNDENETEVTERLRPSLRVLLNNDYWQENIIDKLDDPELSNSNNFRDYFRGLYFKLEQTIGDNSMVMVDLANSSANIALHYKSISIISDEDGDGIPDVADADADGDGFLDDDKEDTDGDWIADEADIDADGDFFPDEGKEDINDDGYNDNVVPVNERTVTLSFSGNRINLFENNFNASVLQEIENPNMVEGDEKLYLKGGEGSMAIIDLFGGVESDEFQEFKSHQDNWIINEANLIFYEDETQVSEEHHENDRIYVYDVKNNIYLIDYQRDLITTSSPFNSVVNHLGRRYTDDLGNKKFKIRITEHINNILLKDSTNTKLGLVISSNVNSINNMDVLGTSDQDDLNKVPSGSVLSPKGTVFYGNNTTNTDKKVKLEIYYTEPDN